MPITQSRMLQLLHAAQDYQQGFNDTFQALADHAAMVRDGKETVEEGFSHITQSLRPEFLLARPLESPSILILETKHFKTFARKNVKSAAWQREKRELLAAGLPIPPPKKTAHKRTAPASIIVRPDSQPSLHRQVSDPDAGINNQELTFDKPEGVLVSDEEMDKMIREHEAEVAYREGNK